MLVCICVDVGGVVVLLNVVCFLSLCVFRLSVCVVGVVLSV